MFIFLQTVKLPAGDGDAVTDTVVKYGADTVFIFAQSS